MTDTTTPPHAEGPEKSILSSMLQTPDVYISRAKADGLVPSMFYSPANARLYRVLIEKHDAGEVVELVGLTEFLIKSNQLNSIGGPAAITEIYTFAPSPAHFAAHLETVRDRYASREALRMSEKVRDAALNGESAQDALTALSDATDTVRLATAQKRSFVNAKEALKKFLAVMNERVDAGDMAGLSTGIHQLDEIGGGMRSGEYWVICGETSAGKSALSYQITLPAIDAGLRVLVFTLEMGSEEVFSRLISCRNRINFGSIMSPKGISVGDGQAIQKAAGALSSSNLLICDEPNMSIDYICAQSEIIAETEPVALVVVDYIQLIEGGKVPGESREQSLARISRRLKQLAKKLKCPVISPAQLNDDGKLRESRAIGQDADVILKINDKGVAVDKFRNAERDGLLPLSLVGEFQRFETNFNQNQNQI